MSRQFEHQQEATLQRLKAMIPADCPLVVRRVATGTTAGGFVVEVLGAIANPALGVSGISGRFQVVAAWISGYLTAWYNRQESSHAPRSW